MKYLLGRQLALTHKAVRAEFEARLSEVGGSLSTWIVLRSAEESAGGEGLSQRALAERMGVEGPTLVRHLDRLEKEGLIQRRRDPADRRVTRISVTPAGQTRLQVLALAADAMEDEIRTSLGVQAHDAVMQALDVLRVEMARQADERKMHAHTAH